MNLNDLYEMRDPRDAYERDVANSTSGFGKDSQAYRADGGANDENHALDQQSSTWYIRLNGKLIRDKSGNPYSFQNKAAANKAALTMQAKLFNKDKEFMLTTNPNDKQQGVAEGYDDGMQPVDLSTKPSFKDIVNRYTQLVYQGHAGETSPEEDQEYDAIEQYVAQRFGEKGSAHLQKAGEVSYWGRDDGHGSGHIRSSNLGRPNQPGGDFRTTKAGKMHGQDAKIMKNKVADRLGRHPAPMLPESDDYSAVTGAITRRIITQHPEVLAKYGPAIVSQAIDEIADFVGDVDEIGSSDVSGWVSQVIRSLGRFAPVRDEGVAEGHTEVKDKEGKVVSWKDDSEWHRAEKNKQGQPKDPRGVVTHLSDVARRKTAAQQGMTEGYYDIPGMQPIDLSSNPSFKDIIDRYTQLVYQGHASETSPEEDQEYDEIEQYVARRFGEKGSTHLQKAGEVSYWGRDDKPYGRDSRGSNLGWPSMPVGNFRTTSKGKMHKQDAGSKKQIIGNRLGQHPAPALPEAEVDSDGYSMDHADSGEYDYEGDQAKDQLNTIVRAARRLNGMLDDNENMPEWVQMKITNAADYIDTAADYIESNQEPELAEGDRVGNMDADAFDAAMARLKQLAGAGPMKTVYDPAKRVYRNIPTAVQPKK